MILILCEDAKHIYVLFLKHFQTVSCFTDLTTVTFFLTAVPLGATGLIFFFFSAAPPHCCSTTSPYQTDEGSSLLPTPCWLRLLQGNHSQILLRKLCSTAMQWGVSSHRTSRCVSQLFGSLTRTALPLSFLSTEPNMCQAAGNWVAAAIPPAIPAPL